MNARPSTVEEYLASFPNDVQSALQQIRKVVYETIPDATEIIRYAIPTVMLGGHYVVYYAAWKHHIGLYPIPPMPADLEPDVAPYRSTKDTMRLPHGTPIPEALIRRILHELVKQRNETIASKPAARKRKAKL
jgi:uncharacterized protein YdhG (YjbR/CyaY superfamily)